MKIYNLGSLNKDYVYSVENFVTAGETIASEKMEIFPGGKGLNQSVALSRAGAKVIHGAVIGDEGEMLLNVLAEAGVNIERIRKISGSCGHAIIQVDKNGQNCILLFAGTNHRIEEDYIIDFLSDAQENDILLLQNEINNLALIFEIANKKRMQLAFNPSPCDENIKNLPLSYVKWWFCNEIEGAMLFGGNTPDEIAEAFLNRFPHSKLILTMGEKGSMMIDSNTRIKQPIYKVPAIDTTAAGDTFTGFFLASITLGKDTAVSLDIASRAAAITVSRSGASSSIPTMREVSDTPLKNTAF